MRIKTIAAAAITVVALVPAGSALAGGGKAATKFVDVEFIKSPQPNPHFYQGTLKSSKGKCVRNRNVRLRVTDGPKISEGKTNSLGNFNLQEQNPSLAGSRTLYALPKDGCKVAKFTLNGGG